MLFRSNDGAATFSSSVTATNFTGAYLDYKPGGVETFIVGKASYNVFDGNQLAIGSFTSIPIEFATANTKRMIITSAGNVGIGTTSPTSKLQVIGTAGKLYIDDSGAGYNYYDASNVHSFRDLSGNSRLYINTSTGNVGIGTTSPTSILQVGAFTGNNALTIGAGTNGYSSIYLGDGTGADAYRGYIEYYHGADALIFATTATERMRITSGGDLLIATTTDAGAYPLQVNGSVYATAYYESSDLRLKNVFSESKGSDGINTIRFKWKDGRDSLTHIGYAAQQVEKVLPDAVKTNADGYKTVNYDEVQTLKISALEQEVAELKALIKTLIDKK